MTDLTIYDAPWRTTLGKSSVIDANKRHVCFVAAMAHDYAAMPLEKNASLIAAAPLLLLAAEAALEHLSNTLNGDPHDPAIVAWNILAEAIAAARG